MKGGRGGGADIEGVRVLVYRGRRTKSLVLNVVVRWKYFLTVMRFDLRRQGFALVCKAGFGIVELMFCTF